MRIVADEGLAANQAPDRRLVDAIAKAQFAMLKLTNGSKQSIASVAETLKMDASDLCRILPLAFLSPKLTEAILTGRHSADLTLRTLTRGPELPLEWDRQEKLLAA